VKNIQMSENARKDASPARAWSPSTGVSQWASFGIAPFGVLTLGTTNRLRADS
jgi:hypothetical protein